MRQKLSEARGRLVLNHFLHGSAWALLAGLTGIVVVRALVPRSQLSWIEAAPWLVVGPLLGALGLSFLRWKSLEAVAREVDRRAGTKDRFVTELQTTQASPWSDAVHREVAAFAANLSLAERFKLPLPGRSFLWLIIPLLALGALEGYRYARRAAVKGELAEAAKRVEEARKAAAKDPELAAEEKRLDEVLKDLADSDEPLREAMRALADLERKMSSSAGQDALSPAETEALAEALASESPQLASELRSGQNEAAASSLSKLDPEALAKALEQAAKHLESQKLQDLARNNQAQQQLGTILRSSPKDGSGDSRKKFLSALRDIKSGASGENKEDGQSGQNGDPSEAPNGSEKPDAGLADNSPPGGAPGSEKDVGKGEELGNKVDRDGGSENPEEFVAGQMDDGEALIEMLRVSGADDPRARRGWKEVYSKAAPAALDAVEKEEIPAGSRLLVKRYFEAIRPKE